MVRRQDKFNSRMTTWGGWVKAVKVLYHFRGMFEFSVRHPFIFGVGKVNKLDKIPQLTIPESGVQDFFDFKLLLTFNDVRDWLVMGLTLWDVIRGVGVYVETETTG